MLDPKCLISATPEVLSGEPILVVSFAPDDSVECGPGPGDFGCWTFLHVHEHVPDDTDLHFFEQIPDLDAATRAIVEQAKPGTYWRESEFAPFEFEP